MVNDDEFEICQLLVLMDSNFDLKDFLFTKWIYTHANLSIQVEETFDSYLMWNMNSCTLRHNSITV